MLSPETLPTHVFVPMRARKVSIPLGSKHPPLQETRHAHHRSFNSPEIRSCHLGRIRALGIPLHVFGRNLLCYYSSMGRPAPSGPGERSYKMSVGLGA